MSAVTLCSYAGHKLPVELLNKAFKDNTTLAIAVGHMEAGKQPRVVVQRIQLDTLKHDASMLESLQEKYKDKDVLFFIDAPAAGTKTDDLPPYTLLWNTDNKPQMVVMFEDVEDAAGEINTYLVPKANDWLAAAGMDVNKLVDVVDKPQNKRDLCSIGGDACIATILYANGKWKQYSRPGVEEKDAGSDFEFGWTTNKFDYTEAKGAHETPIEEEDDDEEEKMLAAILAGKSAAPAKAPVADTKSLTDKAKAPPGGSPDFGYEFWSPPGGMRPDILLKEILKRVQTPPQDYQRLYKEGKLSIPVPKSTTHKDFREALKNGTAKDVKGVANDQPPAKEIPILNKEEIVAAEALVKDRPLAMIDVNKDDILDPALLKTYEGKEANFAQQIGGVPGMAATYGWDFTDLVRLGGGKRSRALALLAFWRGKELIEAQIELHQLKKSKQQRSANRAAA